MKVFDALKPLYTGVSEFSQISKTELFAKVLNNLLFIFVKTFILDVWLGSEGTSVGDTKKSSQSDKSQFYLKDKAKDKTRP